MKQVGILEQMIVNYKQAYEQKCEELEREKEVRRHVEYTLKHYRSRGTENDEVANLKQKCNELQELLQHKEEKVQKLKDKLLSISVSNHNMEALQSKVERLVNELKNERKKSSDYRKQIAEYKKDLNVAMRKVESLEAEVEELLKDKAFVVDDMNELEEESDDEMDDCDI